MNRRVQMRAAVFARGVSGRRVPITARSLPPRFLLPLKWFRGRPVDGLLVEAVSQIDDLRFVNPALFINRRRTGGPIRIFFWGMRSAVEREERQAADEQRHDNRQNQFLHNHSSEVST